MNAVTHVQSRFAGQFRLLARLASGNAVEKLEDLLKSIAESFDLAAIRLRWPAEGEAVVEAAFGTGLNTQAKVLVIEVPLACSVAGTMLAVPAHGNPSDEDLPAGLEAVAQLLGRHPALNDPKGRRDRSRERQRIDDAAHAAGRIAHDFDNIFTGIAGFSELIQSMLEANSPLREYVREIATAAGRGVRFTEQLHHLSRGGVSRPLPSSVAAAVRVVEQRLCKTGPVRLQIDIEDSLPPAAIESEALQTVLSAVIENAVESGGETPVQVAAAVRELSEIEVHEFHGSAEAGRFVEARISDAGAGVRPADRQRLFVEPFFTTKARHRGLGLPVAVRILTAHRGGIAYEPLEAGSLFRIILPLASIPVSKPTNIQTKCFSGDEDRFASPHPIDHRNQGGSAS